MSVNTTTVWPLVFTSLLGGRSSLVISSKPTDLDNVFIIIYICVKACPFMIRLVCDKPIEL